MRYCLNSTKKLDKQLRKLLQSLNEQVSLSLLLACRDPETGIHEARKACKESRALIRLLRPQIGKPEYQRLNGFYRTVSRKLSGNRDAVVMLNTWRQICSELPALQAGSDRLIDDFIENNVTDSAARNIDNAFFLDLSLEVNSQHEAADQWTVPDSITSLKPTIKRIYKKAREAEKTARSSADIEDFHRFRKRSKDLYYCMSNTRPVIKGISKDWVSRLKDMTEIQGLANDHAVLADFLSANEDTLVPDESDRTIIQKEIQVRLGKLQSQSHKLAGKLMVNPPATFITKL